MANKENLRCINTEQAREMAKISAEKRKENKTIADIITAWANKPLTNENKEKLKQAGFPSALTNKALLVMPLINNAFKGDVKSIQMAMELLNEDKERETRIKKLEAEIKQKEVEVERVKLEMEKLKKEINGELVDSQVIILNDVPKVVEDKDNESN